MSRELPEGWTEATLGSVSAFHNGDRGKNYPSGNAILDSGVPFINAGHIQNGKLALSKMNYISEERFDLLGGGKVEPGDLLYCLRGSLGKTAIVPNGMRGAIASSLMILRPSNAVIPNFVYSFLTSPLGASEVEKFDNGSAQPNLSARSVAEYNLPLPPLNEQKRIVAKIDALTEKSREAREALDEVPALLDKLRQSILAAAFRGDLTKNWREQNPNVEPASVLLERIRKERRHKWEEAELAKFKAKGKLPTDDKWKSKYVEPEPVDTEGLPELPKGWCWASLEEACPLEAPVVYGIIQPGDDYPGGIPYIRPIDMTWDGTVRDSSVRFASPEIVSKYKRSELRAGDIILSIVGTIGKVVVTPERYEGANITQSAVRVRPPTCLSPRLLSLMLRSPPVTAQFDKYRFGNAVQRLNVEHARALAIPLCSVAEAGEIERVLEENLGLLPQLSGAVQLDELKALDSSILAKAFRGELVPQDPNDEPASVLLGRIRAEREARGTKTRGRTKA